MNGPEAFTEAARLLDNELVVNSPDERSVPYLLRALGLAVQANTAAVLFRSVPGQVNEGWAEALGYVEKPPPPNPWDLVRGAGQ